MQQPMYIIEFPHEAMVIYPLSNIGPENNPESVTSEFSVLRLGFTYLRRGDRSWIQNRYGAFWLDMRKMQAHECIVYMIQ